MVPVTGSCPFRVCYVVYHHHPVNPLTYILLQSYVYSIFIFLYYAFNAVCNMQLNQQKYIQFYNSFNIKHIIGFYVFFLFLKRCKLQWVKLKRTQKSLFIHFCKRLWLRRSSKRHTVRLNGGRGNTLSATLHDSLFLLEIYEGTRNQSDRITHYSAPTHDYNSLL